MEKLDRQLMAIQCVCFACWISKATDPHTQYIILIAFPHHCSYLNAPQYNILMHCLSSEFRMMLFATTVSQLKMCDFSGEISKGFEVL